MKKYSVVFISIVSLVALFQFGFNYKNEAPAEKAKRYFREKSAQFYESVKKLEEKLMADNNFKELASLQNAYGETRKKYKQAELLTEYYTPVTAKMLNGPLVSRADEEEGTQNVFAPEGLQVIEEIIFSDNPAEKRDDLVREIKRVKSLAFRLSYLAEVQDMDDWQLFDAMQKQLVRIMAMGIAGFDAPYSGNAIIESASATEGVKTLFGFYKPLLKNKSLKKQTEKNLDYAVEYLLTHPDFETFDRMEFITGYINPLYKNITEIQQELGITALNIPSAINKSTSIIFGDNVFNASFYSPGYKAQGSKDDMVSLGKLLFFDPVLSNSLERSCASCHRPQKAFTDGVDKSIAFGGEEKVGRNAPTLINAAFQANYFWDSRVNYLEEQIENVITNTHEMHGDFKEAVLRLNNSNEYKQLFGKAFQTVQNDSITADGIRKAIAEYIRSLQSFNSRFDRHISGKELLNYDEIAGFNLFMGKAACGTCHFLPLFNGTVPPEYSKTEWEIIAVPSSADTIDATLDADLGRYNVKQMELHKFAFKTPTIRNIEFTAPYMHNGVYQTLEQVVDFYNRGGGSGIGINLPTQTLLAEPLGLTMEEQQQLISFLKSLSDTSYFNQIPTKLPDMNDEIYNSRVVGGIY